MFTAKNLLRLAAVLFVFGFVFFVATPARADEGGTVTVTNPTDREFTITLLGPSFSQSVSAHAGKSASFTGLVAGIYSYDLVRWSDGAVTHGQFQLAAGGTQTITPGAPALSLQTPIIILTASLASNDGPPGPETIDLTNPALYIIPGAPAFIFESTIKYTGVDTAGGAKEVSDIGLAEIQTQPQTTQHFLSSSEGDVDSAYYSDTVIISDQMYSAMIFSGLPEMVCNTSLASNVQGPGMLESMFKLQEHITGQTPRVESGIEVNGFVTDKYELSSENWVGDAKPISVFVYVARNGGFITLFETQNREKMKYHGFDPNQFTDISLAYNYIPVEDGSLNIAIPAGCDNLAGLAGEFPVMDGATNLGTSPGQVSYQIEKPRSEVADFYRAEMPNRGWALTTEGTLIGITLVFTKDGKNVEVTVVSRSGDTSAFVTIKEK